MSVSKRVRFEVLRRDNHTCQYCGGIAPDYVLTVDHVVPVALGGSDDPSNLVAACRDCNAGKTSIQPDSPFVKQVSDHAAAYALGMLDKMTRLRADLERETQWAEGFEEIWNGWTYETGPRKGQPVPLPPGWRKSVVRWYAMGVPTELFAKAIQTAMTKERLVGGDSATFAYMAGVIWRTIESLEVDYDITAEHAAVYTEKELDDAKSGAFTFGFNKGWAGGFDYGWERHGVETHHADRALVTMIDGRSTDAS